MGGDGTLPQASWRSSRAKVVVVTGGTRLLGSTSWQPHDAVAPPAAPSLLFKIKLLLVHLPPTTSPSLLFSPSLSHLHTSLTHQEKHHLVPSAPRPRDSSSRHSLPTASQHQQVSPTALALPLPFARVPNPCPAASLHLFRPSRTASEIWRYEAWGMQRAPACSLACSPAFVSPPASSPRHTALVWLHTITIVSFLSRVRDSVARFLVYLRTGSL